MHRISSSMNNANTQSALRLQESKLNRANVQLGSERKITALRDDPIAAGHLVRYQSYVDRVATFEKNAATLSDKFVYSEGYMQNSLEVMQRVREIAVTGSNGIYSRDDLKNMASEVDTLLGQLIQNANATNNDGNSIFGGTNTKQAAFQVEMGNVEGSGVPLVETVRYNGNISENKVEVDEGQYQTFDSAGNKVFWAEQQQLFGARDASKFRASADSVINVDGVDIRVNMGDNVYTIAKKINDSGAAVKASIDPVNRGLNMETTDARQLWLSDTEGTVLADLGIVKDSSQKPPYNLGSSVKVSGGSMFDAVIALRDNLLKGDNEAIGSRVLGTLDLGISSLVGRIAKSGSQYEAAQLNIARNSNTQLNVTAQISREGDLDYTEAITNMRMLDYAHQATLSNAAKMYSTSLLNYMR